MHSTLYYKDEMDRRYRRLMPIISQLTRRCDKLRAIGKPNAAAKLQDHIVRYTVQMGDVPTFIDRHANGPQLITLFSLDWEQIRDRFADNQGRMTPVQARRLLVHLKAREGLAARNARTASGWGLFRNRRQERKHRQHYTTLCIYLQEAIQRKEVIGIAP